MKIRIRAAIDRLMNETPGVLKAPISQIRIRDQFMEGM